MLDHRDDIESDLSAIHHIRDAERSLSSEEYFLLAERLVFYPGVIQMRAKMAHEEASRDGSAPGPSAKPEPGRATTIQSTRGVMEANPSTAGLIEWD